MVVMGDCLSSVVATLMHGYLLSAVDNPQLRGGDPKRDILPHQRHGRGVTVAVVADPGVGRDWHGENLVGVERHRRQRTQMWSFFLESVDGRSCVVACIRTLATSFARRGQDVISVPRNQFLTPSCQGAPFHITYRPFHNPLRFRVPTLARDRFHAEIAAAPGTPGANRHDVPSH